MSYIDCFDHEYVGSLGYLPIYHPTTSEVGPQRGESDFGFTPDNLILGGGSGEHPAIVLHNLDKLVAKFIWNQLTDSQLESLSKKDYNYLFNLTLVTYDELLEFCGWMVGDYSRLEQMTTGSDVKCPKTGDMSAEEWIVQSIGEHIYFSMPEMSGEVEAIKAVLARYGFTDSICPSMNNVKLPTAEYSKIIGRKIVDGDVQWGCAYDYQND